MALCVGDSSFTTLKHLAVLFGGLGALFGAITHRNMLLAARFICLTFLMTSLFLVPKTTLIILDRTQTGKTDTIVDNVPLGLAIMASTTSIIGDSLTQLIEKNFSLPDDIHYGKTGMVMAANLVSAASQFQITDPVFSANLQSFVEQCVFYDLLLHKYTQSDLLNTLKLWDFLKTKSSPARAFLYNDKVTLCQTGAEKLDTDWKTALDNAAAHYSARILGNTENAKANLLQYLGNGYTFLTKLSDSGADILQQNLLANHIHQSLQHWGASLGASAALESYAFTKAQTQKRMQNQTIGDMAAYWLPLMKTCFEGILYGAFLFVFLLSLFPFGLQVLRQYLALLVWVQLWAPLYAIINMIVSYYAQGKSLALAGSGLTLSTLGGLAQVNADMAGLAGYLSLSVPLLAWGLIQGLGSSFTHMAHLIGGTIQSAASASTGETASGNFSLGNTQFATHSQFNTNANHWDSNTRYASGLTSLQTPSGALLSLSPEGHTSLDQHSALSNLGVSINVSDSLHKAASTQAQTSYTAAFNESQAAGQQTTAALRQLSDIGQQYNHSVSSGQGSSTSVSTSLTHSAQDIAQSVHSFAKEHHVSHETALQVLGQVYADAHIGGGFFSQKTLGVSANLSASARGSRSDLYSEAQRFSTDHHLSQSIDTAQRASMEADNRDTSSTSHNLAQSINRSFEQASHLRKEASSHLSTAEAFSTLASTTQDNAVSLNANYSQAFYAWLSKQPTPDGQGTLRTENIDRMATDDPATLQSYAQRFTQQQVDSAIDSTRAGVGSVQAAYQHNNRRLAEKSPSLDRNANLPLPLGAEYSTPNTSLDHRTSMLLEKNRALLSSKENTLGSDNIPLQSAIKGKMEGGVLNTVTQLLEVE